MKRTISLRIMAPLAVVAGIAISISTASLAVKPANWQQKVTRTAIGSHIIGNPAAATKVVEYMSYTCSHCANFEVNDAPKLKSNYIANGKTSLEIRNLLLNAPDLTVAMLARCGGKDRFPGNHAALLAAQEVWLSKVQSISEATRAKMQAGDVPGYMAGAYMEMGLAPFMAKRGISDAQVKACLADKAALDQIFAMTDGAAALGINSTPSFLVNGAHAPNVHNLAALKPLLAPNKN